jgi:type IV pilus assembly protein PilM
MLPYGVDLGTARLCVVALAEEPGAARIENVAVRELPAGASSSGSIARPEVVAPLLREAVAEIGLRERRCIAAVCEPSGTLRRAAFPKMSTFERNKAAAFEAVRFIDYPIRDALVRVFPTGSENDYLLGIVRREVLQSRLRAIRAAGLRPVAVDHEAFAWRRALPETHGVLDVGSVRSTLTLFAEPVPVVRTFATAGETITEHIARSLGIERDLAERRKRTVGEGGAADDAVRELVAEVSEALVELRSSGHDVRRLALAGNGARVRGLAAAIERATGITTAMGEFAATMPSAYPADVMRAGAPDWLFAYGLALWSAA